MMFILNRSCQTRKKMNSLPGDIGSSNFSILLLLRREIVSLVSLGLSITTRGQSNSLTCLCNWISCIALVNPRVSPTLTTCDLFMLFISLILPTLGIPTTPTVMDVFICKKSIQNMNNTVVLEVNKHKNITEQNLKHLLNPATCIFS